MIKQRHSVLPPNLAPIGIDRVEAAAFIGIGVTTFDQLVREGTMPQPRTIKGRLVWHRTELEKAFAALPVRSSETGGGSWTGAF
jgi:predicted DNA-binding transcriptional regulator AlpA